MTQDQTSPQLPGASRSPEQVFVSYRREETEGHAGRLYDSLAARWGKENVFIDVGHIEPGEDFGETINAKLSSCDVVLVVIGRMWLLASDANCKPRLTNQNDWVRLELQVALDRGINVIPVLVQGATMPAEQDLPASLRSLSLSDFKRWLQESLTQKRK